MKRYIEHFPDPPQPVSTTTTSPNKTKSLLLWDVIHANLFHGSSVVFAWLEEVYLESHFDLLGEGSLGEHCLDLWYNC